MTKYLITAAGIPGTDEFIANDKALGYAVDEIDWDDFHTDDNDIIGTPSAGITEEDIIKALIAVNCTIRVMEYDPTIPPYDAFTMYRIIDGKVYCGRGKVQWPEVNEMFVIPVTSDVQ